MSGPCAVRGRRFARPCRKSWPISPGPSCSSEPPSSLPGPAALEPSVYDRGGAASSDPGPSEASCHLRPDEQREHAEEDRRHAEAGAAQARDAEQPGIEQRMGRLQPPVRSVVPTHAVAVLLVASSRYVGLVPQRL